MMKQKIYEIAFDREGKRHVYAGKLDKSIEEISDLPDHALVRINEARWSTTDKDGTIQIVSLKGWQGRFDSYVYIRKEVIQEITPILDESTFYE
jgi:hypothetical protein